MPAKHLKRIATYVEPDVYELIKANAARNKRTLSQTIAYLIEQSLTHTGD